MPAVAVVRALVLAVAHEVSCDRCSVRGSARAATRRPGRGRRRGGRRAPASRGTRPGACSADTRARLRARRRSSRARPSPRQERPDRRRAIASSSTIAGSSPPERTYGPIEIASEQRWVTIRSSKPSNREESSVRAGSVASSSTTACVSGLPCGVSAIDTLLGRVAVDGLERSRDDVDAQHHAGTAAVRLVVHLAGAQRRRVAIVEEAQVELGAEHRGERPLLGHPRERVRNLGEDVETQGRLRLARRRRSRVRRGRGAPRGRRRARTTRPSAAAGPSRARARRSRGRARPRRRRRAGGRPPPRRPGRRAGRRSRRPARGRAARRAAPRASPRAAPAGRA